MIRIYRKTPLLIILETSFDMFAPNLQTYNDMATVNVAYNNLTVRQ